MTAFDDTWNLAYEGLPPDTENINLGAGRIRDFKRDIRERVAVDHSFAGDANDGKHLHTTLMVQATDPTLDAGDGSVYTKTVAGVNELFWKDSAGNVLQLTSAGQLKFSEFASGVAMLFPQAAPPTGWTQDATVNDRVLRVVSGAGGGTGGAWTITGCTVSTAVTTTTTTSAFDVASTATPTIGSHALSTSELPNAALTANAAGGASNIGVSAGGLSAMSGSQTQVITTSPMGNGNGHTHPGSTVALSLSLGASSSSSSPAVSTPAFDGTWRPAYLNVIRATKN